MEFQHVKPGKGAAFVRTKMKNVVTGAVTETSFNPTAKFEEAFVERKDMAYSYNDGDLYYFMDQETYDMIPLSKDMLGDAFRFVKENTVCKVLSYKGSVFGLERPNFVELEVTETEPGVWPATPPPTPLKPATVETGAEVKVPLFINIGDKIQHRHPYRRVHRPGQVRKGPPYLERRTNMEISEKVAYLKGLAEGLALDTESKEGKLIAAIIDVLDDMSGKFEDLEDELCDVEDGLDAVSDDLCEVEEALYELEDDDDEYDEDEDDDEEYFETTCPVCEEEIVFDEDTLESGEIRCPNCGEKLEFDLSDLADAEDEDRGVSS